MKIVDYFENLSAPSGYVDIGYPTHSIFAQPGGASDYIAITPMGTFHGSGAGGGGGLAAGAQIFNQINAQINPWLAANGYKGSGNTETVFKNLGIEGNWLNNSEPFQSVDKYIEALTQITANSSFKAGYKPPTFFNHLTNAIKTVEHDISKLPEDALHLVKEVGKDIGKAAKWLGKEALGLLKDVAEASLLAALLLYKYHMVKALDAKGIQGSSTMALLDIGKLFWMYIIKDNPVPGHSSFENISINKAAGADIAAGSAATATAGAALAAGQVEVAIPAMIKAILAFIAAIVDGKSKHPNPKINNAIINANAAANADYTKYGADSLNSQLQDGTLEDDAAHSAVKKALIILVVLIILSVGGWLTWEYGFKKKSECEPLNVLWYVGFIILYQFSYMIVMVNSFSMINRLSLIFHRVNIILCREWHQLYRLQLNMSAFHLCQGRSLTRSRTISPFTTATRSTKQKQICLPVIFTMIINGMKNLPLLKRCFGYCTKELTGIILATVQKIQCLSPERSVVISWRRIRCFRMALIPYRQPMQHYIHWTRQKAFLQQSGPIFLLKY
jgi:hypothetical protein